MYVMANIEPKLKSKLEGAPNSVVNLIVRLKDPPDAHVTDVRALGLNIRYTYTLVAALAVQGPASASLALARKPWVLSMEEDKPVHTM
jgi:hypothetical protein